MTNPECHTTRGKGEEGKRWDGPRHVGILPEFPTLLSFSVISVCSGRSMLPLKISNVFPKSLFMFNVHHRWMHTLLEVKWLCLIICSFLCLANLPYPLMPFLLILIFPWWDIFTGLSLNFCIHVKHACVSAETSEPANLLIPREYQSQDKLENLGLPKLASAHPCAQHVK